MAKRLARLIIEAGDAGPPALKPALEKILAGRSLAAQRAFLKAFHKAVLHEWGKDTLTIESAGELPEEVIQAMVDRFQEKNQRAIHVERRLNPQLIAGMRVRFGDSVYDASLAHNLQILATRMR